MQKTCANGWCKTPFEVTDEDLAFYDKVSPLFGGKKYLISPPTLCPDCRQQRRISFRNERYLYARTCNATKKPIIAMYSADAAFPVYQSTFWWSDNWNPHDYGQEWEESQPFFKQFKQLMHNVPRLGNVVSSSENCDFNNFCAGSKNCYMSQRLGESEDVFYSYLSIESRSITDCYNTVECELCYDVIDAKGCYNVVSSQNVVGCADSLALFNCRDCRECILCENLRGAEYFIRNVRYSKEEYERLRDELVSSDYRKRCAVLQESIERRSQCLVPSIWSTATENVSGNYLVECKNARHSYDCSHCEDVTFAYGQIYGTDCMDSTFGFRCDECYEFAAGVRSKDLRFCFNILEQSHALTYCIDCTTGSHDLFGCISMKHAKYCILNKQYTKEEYDQLVPKIIEKMKTDGEWGEFFPVTMSPFKYHETVAQEYFPLTREQAIDRGFVWSDYEAPPPEAKRVIKAKDVPDALGEIPDDILNWAIVCEATGRPFKIIKQELDFYRKMNLPIPRLYPDERHRRRMALRNPRKLWNRECSTCQKPIETSYAPDRPETVVCEECYLREVY